MRLLVTRPQRRKAREGDVCATRVREQRCMRGARLARRAPCACVPVSLRATAPEDSRADALPRPSDHASAGPYDGTPIARIASERVRTQRLAGRREWPAEEDFQDRRSSHGIFDPRQSPDSMAV